MDSNRRENLRDDFRMIRKEGIYSTIENALNRKCFSPFYDSTCKLIVQV